MEKVTCHRRSMGSWEGKQAEKETWNEGDRSSRALEAECNLCLSLDEGGFEHCKVNPHLSPLKAYSKVPCSPHSLPQVALAKTQSQNIYVATKTSCSTLPRAEEDAAGRHRKIFCNWESFKPKNKQMKVKLSLKPLKKDKLLTGERFFKACWV